MGASPLGLRLPPWPAPEDGSPSSRAGGMSPLRSSGCFSPAGSPCHRCTCASQPDPAPGPPGPPAGRLSPSHQLPSCCWSGGLWSPSVERLCGTREPPQFPHCPQRIDRLAGGQTARTPLSSRARDQGRSVPRGRGAACSQGGRVGTLGGGSCLLLGNSPPGGPAAAIRARMWLGETPCI